MGSVFAAMLGLIAYGLYATRLDVQQRADQATANLALSLDRSIESTLAALDHEIQTTIAGLRIPELKKLDPALRHAVLFAGAEEARPFGGITLSDASGRVIDRSSGDTKPNDVADRQWFKLLSRRDDLGLVISAPVRSKLDGQWVLALARRIDDAKGEFAGTVSTRIHLRYFSSLFANLDVGPRGAIALFSTDRHVILRQPFSDAEVGSDASGAPVFVQWLRAVSGSYTGRSGVDGVERLLSYRQVGHYPIVLTVALEKAEVFGAWNRRVVIISAVFGFLAAIGVIALGLLRYEIERRTRAERHVLAWGQRHAEALARLDALFQGASDAMFIAAVGADGGMRFERVNPVWSQLMGIVPGQAADRTPHELFPVDYADRIVEGWRQCLRERMPVEADMTLDVEGAVQEWNAKIVPVLGETGSTRRIVGIARNVTERNRQEAELRRSQRLEAVGELTSGIAHDFGNLLQAIIGSLDVIAGEPLNPRIQPSLAVIDGAARRGTALTHRLLAFSRSQPLEPVVVDPVAAMSDVVELASRTMPAIQIEQRTAADCWPVHVDATQLDTCLLNLALNARDAMPGGGRLLLTVENVAAAVAADSGMPRQDYVCFGVADEGEGMDTATLARACEPFFTTKPAGIGSGLGLSMVHGFALQSGGALDLQSEPGRGTVARIWLPRWLGALSPDRPLAVQPALKGQQKRILVVDDDDMVREAMTMLLEAAGFDPVCLPSADAAWRLLKTGAAADALLTDEYMPGMAGHELVIETLRLRPELPCVLFTGYDVVKGAERLPKSVRVFRKPFETQDLLNHLAHLLEQADNRRSTQREPALG